MALSHGRFNLTAGDRPEALQGARVSADFFHILKMEPVLGRGFNAGEDRMGGERVVVLSDGLWRRRFGADPGIVGRAVTLDGEARAVIGVAPPGIGSALQERDLAAAGGGRREREPRRPLPPGPAAA